MYLNTVLNKSDYLLHDGFGALNSTVFIYGRGKHERKRERSQQKRGVFRGEGGYERARRYVRPRAQCQAVCSRKSHIYLNSKHKISKRWQT